MASTTVRISPETLKVLRDLARQQGEPMQKVLARAVEDYRRHQVLERTNLAYRALHLDPDAWHREMEERQAWDITLPDGQVEP